MSMTVAELRAVLDALPADVPVTVRYDYRYAPVTAAVLDEDYPTLCLSVDSASVEHRFQ